TYKLAIVASIAYEIKVRPGDIYREGIDGIEPVDFRYARELGYAIKLIAHTQRHPGRVEARVHPAMVPLDHPLARVEGAENAVFVEGDLVGQVLLVGQGAGGRPTASAVVGDLIDLARDDDAPVPGLEPAEGPRADGAPRAGARRLLLPARLLTRARWVSSLAIASICRSGRRPQRSISTKARPRLCRAATSAARSD